MSYLILNNLPMLLTCIAAAMIGWFLPTMIGRVLSIRPKLSFRLPRRSTPERTRPQAFFASVADPLDIPDKPDPMRPYLADAIETLTKIRQRENPSLPSVLGTLRKMNAYAFEELVAICLRERAMGGFTPKGYSRDGGVDGWGFWQGRAVVVQAKRWRRHICNRDIVALAELADSVAGIGLFVHTGRTGKKARRKAVRYQVNVLSGRDLVDFVLGREFSMRWEVPEIPEAYSRPLPWYLPWLNYPTG